VSVQGNFPSTLVDPIKLCNHPLMKRVLKSLVVFVALGFAGGAVAEAPKTAPAWELKDLSGKSVRSSDFQGKVVLIDFWATWCPPCRAEVPGLVELQKELGPKGFTVIGVSLDDGPEVVRQFAAKFKVDYPLVMGNEAVVTAFGGVEGIPTKFLIDRSGKIVSRQVGGAEKAEIERQIRPLLEAK